MNRTYRTAWNRRKGNWQAIAETGSAHRGHSGSASATLGVVGAISSPVSSLAASGLLAMVLPFATASAADLPAGGHVVAGDAAIARQGDSMTIDQQSHNAAIDWQEFSIGADKSVRFNQPGADAATLNRVTGDHVSDIRGALEANGRVFLVNPNGVHFSPTARVDVGALITSTLDISTDDFMAGRYTFEGGSGNAVINQGNITAAEGGTVAMIAAEIINTGSINTPRGNTLMGAGSRVTLDLGGPVKIEVEEARLDTHIEQGGAIRADGGLIYLTAKAANELTASVINHTGISEARTLASGENGQIMLMGDMESGRVEVAGTLDASAPDALNPSGGDGGFIETSAAKVSFADNVQVTTKADNGQTGEWLIDPTDITIDPGAGGEDTLEANLASTNVTLDTASGGIDSGDITVNADLDWVAATTLTLKANNDIAVNGSITAPSGTLALDAVSDITSTGAIEVSVFDLVSGHWQQNSDTLADFSANDFRVKEDTASFLRVQGGIGSSADPYQITDVYGLQGMQSHALLGNDFVLVNDIAASGTVNWNSGKGFDPIGDSSSRFTGSLDGQGHIIDGLTIDRAGEDSVGLFAITGSASSLTGIGLVAADITGGTDVGALAGYNNGNIRQSYATGEVSGDDFVGGLVGVNGSNLSHSYATSDVSGNNWVGGLVGENNFGGLISQSYASGSVSGNNAVGGLVGYNESIIENSFWSSDTASIGVGLNSGPLHNTSGKTLVELQNLQTFEDAGWDIDAQGGTGAVWRIYDGHTTPLLRAFMTELNVDTDDATGTYDGTFQTGSGTWSVNAPHDDSLILGAGTVSDGGTDAGGHAIELEGLYSSQQGYDLILNDGTLTIDKAAATITANSDTVTYNGGNQSVSGFTASGLVGGEGESVLTAINTSGGEGINAGSYAHTASGTDSNYDLTFSDGTLTIDKAAATVTANSDTVTYNGGNQSVSGFTASGLVGGEDESVLTAINTSGGQGTNAGSYAHTASGTDSNYDLTFNDGTLTIDKAAATVTANSDTVTYNGGNQSVSGFTASGLVGGVLTAISTSGGEGINAGSYAHTASGTDGNYELTFVDGGLTIDKATATVTANSDTVTYNGGNQSVSGFTASGLVGGEDESVLTAISTSGGQGTSAGSYAHTANGTDSNYELTFNDGTLTIDKAAATITANSDTVTYNGGNQSVSGFTASGLVGGEDESVLADVSTTGGQGTNAGSYAHTASGTDSNYDLTFNDGTLTIDKAAATVTANSDIVTYNGGNQSVSGFTASGLVGGEDESVLTAISTSGGKGINAGSYAHTASGTDSNYDLTFNDGTLTIDKAAATVTANSDTVTYNGGNQNVSGFTASGLVGGEDESVLTAISTSGGEGINAGSYAHTASGTDGNYELAFVDGALTIDKAAATITANSDTVTYDSGVQNVSGFTASGLVGGEDESVLADVSTSGGEGTNAGSYAHTVSGSDGNYELTFNDGTLTIDKAAATITANSDTVTYNGGNQSVSGFTASGLVGGEDESVLTAISTSGGQGTNAGSYAHTASGTDGNYELTFEDGTLTITPRPVSVIANNQHKKVGDTEPELTYETGCGALINDCGLVADERLAGQLERDAGEAIGNYTINQGTVTDSNNANYAITFEPGELVVAATPAPTPEPEQDLPDRLAQIAFSALQQETATKATAGEYSTVVNDGQDYAAPIIIRPVFNCQIATQETVEECMAWHINSWLLTRQD